MSETLTSSEQLREDLEAISERIWDIRQELADAELARAGIMNILKDRKGTE